MYICHLLAKSTKNIFSTSVEKIADINVVS